jgi:hypothetical protein
MNANKEGGHVREWSESHLLSQTFCLALGNPRHLVSFDLLHLSSI